MTLQLQQEEGGQAWATSQVLDSVGCSTKSFGRQDLAETSFLCTEELWTQTSELTRLPKHFHQKYIFRNKHQTNKNNYPAQIVLSSKLLQGRERPSDNDIANHLPPNSEKGLYTLFSCQPSVILLHCSVTAKPSEEGEGVCVVGLWRHARFCLHTQLPWPWRRELGFLLPNITNK